MLQQAGKNQEALLALQAVAAAAPSTPGLLSRLQAAATLALRSRGRGSPAAMHEVGEGVGAGHYAVLGITAAADDAAVRRAYRQQAARWHPDKWAAADAVAQQHAAAEFLMVQQAYDVLSNQQERALHDLK